MILVDSHCHLDMLIKHDSLDDIILRASAADVFYMQTICTKIEDLPTILSISEKYKNVFASVGVHPSEVTKHITAQELIEFSKHPKIIGLGETGLDYHYNKDESQQSLQKVVFEEHIKAACKTKIPLIIHTRNAEKDTYDIIDDYKKIDDFPGLIHCFTASPEFAKKILDLDFYISFAGIVTFKNAEELRSIVKFVPLNRILLETDSPYLAPVPKRGHTNEPSNIKYIAQIIAELKNITLEHCAEQTSKNFFTLFSKTANNL